MNCVAFVPKGTIASIKNANSDIGQEFWNFGYMEVTDRPKDYNGDKWDSFTQFSPSRIAKLSDISTPIVWLNGERAALADGEFILPVGMLSSLINNNQNHETWWDSSYLQGFELEIFNNAPNLSFGINCLNDVISNYDRIAIYKSVMNLQNGTSQWNEIADYIVDHSNFNADEVQYWDVNQMIREYVNVACMDSSFDNLCKTYLNDVIARYDIAGQVLDLRGAGLIAYVEYNGNINVSNYSAAVRFSDFNSQYTHTILQYYAFSHFNEAKAYYLSKHPNAAFTWAEAHDGKEFADFYQIINEYTNSFFEGTDGNGAIKAEMRDYIFNKYAPLLLDVIDTTGLKTRIQTHSPSYNEYEYDFKLVGVTSSDSYVNYVFGSDNIYSLLLGGNADGVYAFAVAPMPTGRADVEKLVKFSYEEFDNDITFGLANSVTFELDMVDEVLDTLGQVFLYVGLALAVFASLMLSNFIATSISLKKQEIGILRAIGSRSNDVFRIFFAEAFIIAMINFFLAIVATGVVSAIINSILREDIGILITILSFGLRQIGLLLLVSLAVAFISTFIPVKKIASKKPIDAIRKR